jgi:hypothetical protein
MKNSAQNCVKIEKKREIALTFVTWTVSGLRLPSVSLPCSNHAKITKLQVRSRYKKKIQLDHDASVD